MSTIFLDPAVKAKYEGYPKEVAGFLMKLRTLIFSVAQKTDGVGELVEALKWGEPSYVSQIGSPIRLDWKAKYPEHCSVFFNCRTKLLSTFREIYPDVFEYYGSREIRLPIGDTIPNEEILKHCIELALTYRRWAAD